MWSVMDFESIDIDGTATGFTSTVRTPALSGNTRNFPATSVIVEVVFGSIMATFDGTTPTGATDIGHFYGPGSVFLVSTLPDIERFLAINLHGAARLNCTYMRNE